MTDDIVILTATSGDTGGAALSGFSDIEGIKIIVFYPKNGTSTVQERQMVSCEGKNTCVCAVVGNFDDAQSGVKKIFSELKLPEGVQLSSANSINIGRLAPQVAYYFKSYADLIKAGKIKMGDKVNYIVPTGNFGDILAGLFAKKMGLFVGKLVCASNENKVLTEFFENGTYNKNRAFHVTKSPSMDILISSNLERLLYIVCGAEKCAKYMKDLNEKGEYTVSSEELNKIRELIDAGYADDKDSYETIKSVYDNNGYLMDTHTAVAWSVYEKWIENTQNTDTCVVLSTASAYKFASSVMTALEQNFDGEFDAVKKLNAFTKVTPPYGLDGIEDRVVIHKTVLEKGEMLDFVADMVAKKTWSN
jgi:threonine synthase